MTIVLTVVIAEWLLFSPLLWRAHKALSIILSVAIALTTVWLALSSDSWIFGIIFVILGIFRCFNMARITKGRMHNTYLHRATLRTSIILGVIFVVVVASAGFLTEFNPRASWLLYVAGLQLIGALSILAITGHSIRLATRKGSKEAHFADRDLPTVTVAVPARNETTDLEICIQSLLASDYPKLEIVVLDDCSQDTTSDIIKKFAHDGVRFIKGTPPADRWLAKNQAYARLAEEASGQYILFCGVDTRFSSSAIRILVQDMLLGELDMVSVLPRRLTNNTMAAFIQPMRYWWELCLPRQFFKRPPVLSTCWAIRRESLQRLGGFEAVSNTVLPERYFARELAKINGYSFLRADELLDVQTSKQLPDQRETALRVRYPQLHKRPELVLLMATLECCFLLGPLILIIVGTLRGDTPLLLTAGLAYIVLLVTHILVVLITNPGNVPIAIINFPAVVCTELFLGHESMIRYEFGTISWKERNICIPVMHVIPRLPTAK